MNDKKRCLIIGAGPGIGLAVARKFGKNGFGVVLINRSATTTEELIRLLSADGIAASAFIANAGDFHELQITLDNMIASQGTPDVLVYNVAALFPALPTGTPPEKLVDDFKVSVGGALVAVQKLAPDMKQVGGTILLTGGSLAHYPSKDMTTLSVSKAALLSLAHLLAQEFSGSKIKVYTITVNVSVNETHAAKIAEKYWEIYTQSPKETEQQYG